MKKLRWVTAIILCLLMIAATAAPVLADGPNPYGVTVQVGEKEGVIRAYNESYAGNIFLSLRDLSRALDGSAAQFRVDYEVSGTDGECWRVSLGQASAPTAAEAGGKIPDSAPVTLALNLRRNRLFVDGGERRYYSYCSEDKDLYLSLADVQLMLDLTVERLEDGRLCLDVEKPFLPDLYALRDEDYFGAFNAVLVGDADTGEILFSHNRAWRYPIASISKLMSYLLLAEAVERGEASWQDSVKLSQKAAARSWSADGIVALPTGGEYPLEELAQAMMLASSNEAALAIAEHLAGSEEAFVARMNERASELGLNSASFYTPHGLPSYSAGALPGKRQNAMSAADLFSLCATVLKERPELTEMTKLQFIHLPKQGYSTANSNPLVFNMPGVNGLKTGSTNRAGYCLAASLPLTVGEETHTLVAVVLGAESAELRGQGAEILLRYASAYYLEKGFSKTA